MIISSRGTGSVDSKPYMTIPTESPTRRKSTYLSAMAAVCAWYEVSETMGSPPLRAVMSGAVRRLIVVCWDMRRTLVLAPPSRKPASSP